MCNKLQFLTLILLGTNELVSSLGNFGPTGQNTLQSSLNGQNSTNTELFRPLASPPGKNKVEKKKHLNQIIN